MGRHGAQDGSVVVLDGKALRGSHSTQLVGAINADSGRTLEWKPWPTKATRFPPPKPCWAAWSSTASSP